MIDQQYTDNLKQVVKKFLEILGLQGDVKESIVEEGDLEYVKIDITGDDLNELVGFNGKNLNSLQYLVSVVANRDRQERFKIIIDVNGYRQKRDEYLRSVAKQALINVTQTGQPISLPSMSAMERRIVHLALQDEKGVKTVSIGDEPDRYIMIQPV